MQSFRGLALRQNESNRRANSRNISTRISLRWTNYHLTFLSTPLPTQHHSFFKTISLVKRILSCFHFVCRLFVYLFICLFIYLFICLFIYSLKYMEREWKAYVDEYTSSEILLPNCVAAAAFLTYCGAMGVDRRFVKAGFGL